MNNPGAGGQDVSLFGRLNKINARTRSNCHLIPTVTSEGKGTVCKRKYKTPMTDSVSIHHILSYRHGDFRKALGNINQFHTETLCRVIT